MVRIFLVLFGSLFASLHCIAATYHVDEYANFRAQEINDNAVMVGIQKEAASMQNGIATPLLPPGFSEGFSIAYGVNNAGVAVGEFITPGHSFDGFAIENGTVVDLVGYHPLAVNENGDSTGFEYTSGIDRAAIRNNGAVTPIVSPPNWDDAFGLDINSSAAVVGEYYENIPFETGGSRVFLYESGTIVDLHSLYFSGAYQSWANAVNDNGWVVGGVQPVYRGSVSAFVYNGVTMTLFFGLDAEDVNERNEVLLWNLSEIYIYDGALHPVGYSYPEMGEVVALNNVGQFVVNLIDGRTTLWTPIPEPSALRCLLIALPAFIGWRRK